MIERAMNKPEKLPPLSETQMEIMKVVWDRKEATLGDIWTELSGQRDVARNTIQTLLTRLVEKGWLKTRMVKKAYYYSPTVARDSSLSAALKRFVSNAFGGSTEELMTALLDGKALTKEEADRIRLLIEQAEHREDKKP
jgi:predicted transcriptional regulator